MRMVNLSAAALAAVCFGAIAVTALADDVKDGYKGVPRTFLWNPGPIEFTDTTKYKKPGPWVIGFSNASISNAWAVANLHSVQYAASQHKDLIKQLIITDANDDPNKQASDIQDLIQRKPDLLIIRPATTALDPAVARAMKSGIPVVLNDREVSSQNFVSLVNADDWSLGRVQAQWMAESLNFKGNVVMIAGIAGASPAENRIKAAKEVFNQYPGIKILDVQYTDWSPTKGKTVVAALIQKYGKEINALWADHGLEVMGGIEAFIDAGWKDGEMPMTFCADFNGCLEQAVKHKIPVLDYNYPPAMGGWSVEVALKVLQGIPVPKHYVLGSDIVISKGHETASVKADRWAEDYVQAGKDPFWVVSSGIPNYDPKTFKAE
jgi:ribose transport system substrate-binding protein